VYGGAGPERVVPAGLERGLEVVAHAVGGVGVEAAHSGHLVAEALFGEDLGDAVFGHPGLVAVPEPVRGEALLNGQPASQRRVREYGLDASAAWRDVLRGARLGWWPHGDRRAGPHRGVGDD
jgi:hypothetical protein